MSKENGFVPIRRGILEHIRDGRITPLEFTAHYFITSQADTRTGKWIGSAKCIASALCITERMARRVLENLSRGDYIRRFPVPGKHVCYPILVHKFYPTNGQHKGEQLDAISSLSPTELRYVPIDSGELEGEQKGEHVTPQKRSEKREERSKAAKPPADSRFGPFLELAKASFEAKHNRPPTWDCFGKDGAALSAFLRRAPHVTLEIWTAHLSAFFDSTEAFTVRQGGGLCFFVSRFDTFSSGPIFEKPLGGRNGKPNVNEAVAITMQAAALNARRFN